MLVFPSSFLLGKDGDWRTEGRPVTVGDAMATVGEGFSEVSVTNLVFAVSVVLYWKAWPLLTSSSLSGLKLGSGFRLCLPFTSQLASGKLLKLLGVSF